MTNSRCSWIQGIRRSKGLCHWIVSYTSLILFIIYNRPSVVKLLKVPPKDTDSGMTWEASTILISTVNFYYIINKLIIYS
jgi:hypothetical protein